MPGVSRSHYLQLRGSEITAGVRSDIEPVALTNPISADMAVMRSSLLPGLVGAVLRNTNRQQPRTRLFESGLRFIPGEAGLQIPTLAMVATGERFAESWAVAGQAADFFSTSKAMWKACSR